MWTTIQSQKTSSGFQIYPSSLAKLNKFNIKLQGQSRRHGRALVGLAPQTKLQSPEIEI